MYRRRSSEGKCWCLSRRTAGLTCMLVLRTTSGSTSLSSSLGRFPPTLLLPPAFTRPRVVTYHYIQLLIVIFPYPYFYSSLQFSARFVNLVSLKTAMQCIRRLTSRDTMQIILAKYNFRFIPTVQKHRSPKKRSHTHAQNSTIPNNAVKIFICHVHFYDMAILYNHVFYECLSIHISCNTFSLYIQNCK